MKKILTIVALAVFIFSAAAASAAIKTVPGDWQIEGQHSIVFTCGGGQYPHTLTDGFPGSGMYDANNSYTWDMTGSITGDTIDFKILYTGINAGYTLNGVGTISPDGSISGTTDSNCQTFDMLAGTATRFEGNHGQYVSNQENKKEAAQSRIGMPAQSKGHTK